MNNPTLEDLVNIKEGINDVIDLLNRATTGNLARSTCLCILGMLDKKLNKLINNEQQLTTGSR